jgi:hypothetical protein
MYDMMNCQISELLSWFYFIQTQNETFLERSMKSSLFHRKTVSQFYLPVKVLKWLELNNRIIADLNFNQCPANESDKNSGNTP